MHLSGQGFDQATSKVKSTLQIPEMPPQLPTTTSAAATYTTIPISGVEVVSRSTQNLSTCLSRRRPWPEFLTSFDLPASLSDASARFRRNASYFSINYSIIIVVCTAAALIGTPIALILVAAVFYLWLIFHFFREDPLVVRNRQVSNFAVILGLVLVSVAALWITGPLSGLSTGIGIGLVVSVIHGVVRNPEGLFLDENGAVSNGLIASASGAGPSPRGGGISVRPPL